MKNLRRVLSHAGGGGGSLTAFTMAEILLSLTIIGVVAAITLPSLTGNINERTWNTQRKALYARMSQAVALMPALNGYGTLTEDADGNVTEDNVAETFITAGLAKVLKINNVCDSEHLSDCGIASSLTTFTASKIPVPEDLKTLNEQLVSISNSEHAIHNRSMLINTRAAAFETQNGESIIAYYNPRCRDALQQEGAGHSWHYLQNSMCANFVYDLNGTKGPNTVGKDIGFISILYPADSVVVSVMPVGNSATAATQPNIGEACTALNPDAKAPNMEEGAAIFYNKDLIGDVPLHIWTSTVISSNKAWHISNSVGYRESYTKTVPLSTYCIRRN